MHIVICCHSTNSCQLQPWEPPAHPMLLLLPCSSSTCAPAETPQKPRPGAQQGDYGLDAIMCLSVSPNPTPLALVKAWTTPFPLGGLFPLGHVVFTAEVSVQGFVLPGLLLTGWIRQVFLKSSLLFQAAGEEIPLGIRLRSITLEQNRGCQQGERRAVAHGHPSEKTDSRLRHHTYRSTEFRTTMQHHLSQNDACTYLYHRLINLLPGRQTASGSKRGPRKGSEKINKQTIA